MKNICFCFQMHAPMQLRRYRFFEIGQDHYYYDDMATEERLTWLVRESYMPLLGTLKDMIRLSKGKFKCALAVCGTTLEQLEQYTPEVIDLMKELVATKCVEMVATPYSYSLAAQYSETEWELQMKMQEQKVNELFGVKPAALFNTELLYSDEIADLAWKLGYKVVMTEGAKHILSWKSPAYVYHSTANPKQTILVRDMQRSDELSFHFSDPAWPNYPIDAEKFVRQLGESYEEDNVVNIWLGADAFGINQLVETGIFEFMKALPYYALEQNIGFVTPSEAAKKMQAQDTLSSPYPLTWAGEGKSLSLFDGNDLQQEALNKMYAVAERVHMCKDKALKTDWQLLQDADYLHYMNHIDRGSSNFESAYDAFINFMNILSDFLQLVDEQYPTTIENEELNSLLKTINNQEKEISRLTEELKKAKKAKTAEPKAAAEKEKKVTKKK